MNIHENFQATNENTILFQALTPRCRASTPEIRRYAGCIAIEGRLQQPAYDGDATCNTVVLMLAPSVSLALDLREVSVLKTVRNFFWLTSSFTDYHLDFWEEIRLSLSIFNRSSVSDYDIYSNARFKVVINFPSHLVD
jgi:hypothetical protein